MEQIMAEVTRKDNYGRDVKYREVEIDPCEKCQHDCVTCERDVSIYSVMVRV